MQNLDLEKWSERVLRVSMALVFLWFGVNQLMDSSMWEGFVPLWIVEAGLSAKMLVTANGVMEIVLGVMLILGLWVRWVALVLALHLMGIAATIGFNATGVRDFGLALATLAIAIRGK